MNNKTYECDVCQIEKLNPDGSVFSTEPFESKSFTTLTKAKAWCKSMMKDKRFYVAWIEQFESGYDDFTKQYHFYKGDKTWSQTSNN